MSVADGAVPSGLEAEAEYALRGKRVLCPLQFQPFLNPSLSDLVVATFQRMITDAPNNTGRLSLTNVTMNCSTEKVLQSSSFSTLCSTLWNLSLPPRSCSLKLSENPAETFLGPCLFVDPASSDEVKREEVAASFSLVLAVLLEATVGRISFVVPFVVPFRLRAVVDSRRPRTVELFTVELFTVELFTVELFTVELFTVLCVYTVTSTSSIIPSSPKTEEASVIWEDNLQGWEAGGGGNLVWGKPERALVNGWKICWGIEEGRRTNEPRKLLRWE